MNLQSISYRIGRNSEKWRDQSTQYWSVHEEKLKNEEVNLERIINLGVRVSKFGKTVSHS